MTKQPTILDYIDSRTENIVAGKIHNVSQKIEKLAEIQFKVAYKETRSFTPSYLKDKCYFYGKGNLNAKARTIERLASGAPNLNRKYDLRSRNSNKYGFLTREEACTIVGSPEYKQLTEM